MSKSAFALRIKQHQRHPCHRRAAQGKTDNRPREARRRGCRHHSALARNVGRVGLGRRGSVVGRLNEEIPTRCSVTG